LSPEFEWIDSIEYSGMMSKSENYDYKTEVARLIEENFFQFRAVISRLPDASIHPTPHLTIIDSGLLHAPWNAVLRTQLPSGEVDRKIEEVLGYFQSRKLPFSWWIGPTTRPAEIESCLQAHGFAYQENTPGMAIKLREVNENTPSLSFLTIKQVSSETDLERFVRVVRYCFHLPKICAAALFNLYLKIGWQSDAPFHHFLGWWKGRAVASASLFFAADVAGIYLVGTFPETRGRGIGTAMTLACLQRARELGFNLAVLRSSPLGENVYRRIGFREYCRLKRYVWDSNSGA